LAFENMIHGNFPLIERLLREYSPDHIGLCYDSGHGNMNPDGLQMLERLKDRLISVHLHDNGKTSSWRSPESGRAWFTRWLSGSVQPDYEDHGPCCFPCPP
jgi:sugar phosphate isomerase/epimerase